MNEHEATEIAYKNGYKQGRIDAVKEMQSKLYDEFLTVAICQKADEPNMRSQEVFAILEQKTKEFLEKK